MIETESVNRIVTGTHIYNDVYDVIEQWDNAVKYYEFSYIYEGERKRVAVRADTITTYGYSTIETAIGIEERSNL